MLFERAQRPAAAPGHSGPAADADPLAALRTVIVRCRHLSPHKRALCLLGSPTVLWAAVMAVLRMERMTVVLPRSAAGLEIERSLRMRTGVAIRSSVAAGVLELPAKPEDYLVGRRRQALRTNARRAHAAGVVCREPGRGEIVGLLTRVLSARGDDEEYCRWIVDRLHGNQGRFWVAELANGDAVGLAAVTVAGEWAYLSGMLSVPSVDASAVRYKLSGDLFTQLAGEGVRFVLTGSTLVTSPGLVYFQQRLGFELRRLAITAQ